MNQFDAYAAAQAAYAACAVDTEQALELLAAQPISIHCWQGDDVAGFDRAGGAGDGIQATGSYPGRARNFTELTSDFDQALALIPGRKRINLHASYAVFGPDEWVDRDQLEYRHFEPWVEYARSRQLGIDFNPTCFGHPMVRSGLTLSSPDDEVRQFWITHAQASRRIASEIGAQLGDEVLNNVWVPDGFKEVPSDRLRPRQRLKASLDEVFAEQLPYVVDSVESKLFGIGVESFTVGSSEFYLNYAAARPGVYNLLDTGHYHPTEQVSEKISALLCFRDQLMLHISRPVRWDSDHVVLLDDETIEICKEIVRNQALERTRIGLDFFDASINRVAAWVIGARNVQKALLYALLQPYQRLAALQDAGDTTARLVASEELKMAPFGAVWAEYCERSEVPGDGAWLGSVRRYESEVLSRRSER